MDNVIDTNLKVIEDFKKELLEIFEDVSDEHFSEMKVELLNHIAKAYSGPEAEQAIPRKNPLRSENQLLMSIGTVCTNKNA